MIGVVFGVVLGAIAFSVIWYIVVGLFYFCVTFLGAGLLHLLSTLF